MLPRAPEDMQSHLRRRAGGVSGLQSLQQSFPCLSSWAPGPSDQMNVEDPNTSGPLLLSFVHTWPLVLLLQRLTAFLPHFLCIKPNPIDDFFLALSPMAHWSLGNHVGPALPGVEGKAGCLKHEAQNCHFTGWDLGTRGGRDQPKITQPEEGKSRSKGS